MCLHVCVREKKTEKINRRGKKGPFKVEEKRKVEKRERVKEKRGDGEKKRRSVEKGFVISV